MSSDCDTLMHLSPFWGSIGFMNLICMYMIWAGAFYSRILESNFPIDLSLKLPCRCSCYYPVMSPWCFNVITFSDSFIVCVSRATILLVLCTTRQNFRQCEDSIWGYKVVECEDGGAWVGSLYLGRFSFFSRTLLNSRNGIFFLYPGSLLQTHPWCSPWGYSVNHPLSKSQLS